MDGICRQSGTRRGLLLLAIATLTLMGACSGVEVQTQRDPAIAIPAEPTYAWGPAPAGPLPAEVDPRVLDPQLAERIRLAVQAGLAAKGFRQAPAETADFLVAYRVGVWSHLREATEFSVDPQGRPLRAYSGAYIGGPYGPPPNVETGTVEVTEGRLLLTLVDRATGKVAYQALARRENLSRQAGSEQAVRDVVIRLLEDLR